MGPTKFILKSKTFWVNVFTLAASLSGYLPSKWTTIVLAISNIALRIVTTEGITFISHND